MLKKNVKKYLSSVLAIAVVISSLAVGFSAYGVSYPIAINAENFPNRNFRIIVTDEYDENTDGYLSQEEIEGVTFMSLTGINEFYEDMGDIENIKGIEYFTSLKTLRCGGIGLTELDVSEMPQLESITCRGNELTELDVSNNTNLKSLYCESNNITALDVTKNTKLVTLFCYANSISSIDVTKNTSLTALRVDQNELTSLDVSKNTALKTFFCKNNHLKELDLSANTNLTSVTEYEIGEQSFNATATLYGNKVFVPVTFSNSSNIVSTSLDTTVETDDDVLHILGYSSGNFISEDIDTIVDGKGIDYYYNVGLDIAENMSVHIDLDRDFFLVRFYTSSDKSTLLSKDVASYGEAAEPPSVSAPQCKKFNSWSEDISNVTSDLDVYVVWDDDHDKYIAEFDEGVVFVECANGCGETWSYVFSEIAGAKAGDRDYVEIVDINSDGVINGKDYGRLLLGNY